VVRPEVAGVPLVEARFDVSQLAVDVIRVHVVAQLGQFRGHGGYKVGGTAHLLGDRTGARGPHRRRDRSRGACSIRCSVSLLIERPSTSAASLTIAWVTRGIRSVIAREVARPVRAPTRGMVSV
jgi:hypothetical protein